LIYKGILSLVAVGLIVFFGKMMTEFLKYLRSYWALVGSYFIFILVLTSFLITVLKNEGIAWRNNDLQAN
jgi:uncharacterized protein (DUF983 family)